MSQIKALVLFSGGLDSVLAVKIFQRQNIKVVGVCLESVFFSAEKAKIIANEIDIKLEIVDINQQMVKLIKNPPNGYGKHLNPCIDCHALMIKTVADYFFKNSKQKYNFDFIATGEVLGQRPFSQNRVALDKVEKIAGIEILRPLSAKLLDETIYEKNKLVKRKILYNIKGRSREKQIELSKKFKIKNVPSPAGGCILTDSEFSNRLGKMLDYWPKCNSNDIKLLKNGRVFWFKNKNNKKILAVIGRNEKDNNNLKKFAQKGDYMIELKDITGPITLVRNNNKNLLNLKTIIIPKKLKFSELEIKNKKNNAEIQRIIELLTGYYSVKARGKKVKLLFNNYYEK